MRRHPLYSSTPGRPGATPVSKSFRNWSRYQTPLDPQGLATIFVSADLPAQRQDALNFLLRHRAPMPGYIKIGSDPEFIEAIDPRWSGTLPATVLFDAERRPRHFWEGRINKPEVEEAIRGLLAEQQSRTTQ